MDNQDKKRIDVEKTIFNKDELYNCKRKIVNQCQQENESPSTSKSENLPSKSENLPSKSLIDNQNAKPKKKKKNSYKELMKTAMSSGKTDKKKKEEYQEKLMKNLGGGQFSKLDKI